MNGWFMMENPQNSGWFWGTIIFGNTYIRSVPPFFWQQSLLVFGHVEKQTQHVGNMTILESLIHSWFVDSWETDFAWFVSKCFLDFRCENINIIWTSTDRSSSSSWCWSTASFSISWSRISGRSSTRFTGKCHLWVRTLRGSGYKVWGKMESWFLDVHIPPWKLTWPWKIHHLKMYFLLKMVIFQCYVRFQGCNRKTHPKDVLQNDAAGIYTWWLDSHDPNESKSTCDEILSP